MDRQPDQASLTGTSSQRPSACNTCRARKVRCDRRPGSCTNCERLGLSCTSRSWANLSSTTSDPETSAGRKRKRTFHSCLPCREMKTKCSGDRPTCERCKRKSTQCQYDESSEPAWKLQIETELRYGNRSVQGQHSHFAHRHSGFSPGNVRPNHHAENGTNRQAETTVDPRSGESHSGDASILGGDEARPRIDAYFAHVHPLRCFGFLHKPSFMHNLDHRDPNTFDEDALLLIMCALGDMFCTDFDGNDSCLRGKTPSRRARWADRAQRLLFAQIGRISAESLMAAVLLQDYAIRMADWGTAFMLSGLIARMTQALQINLEHSTDVLCQDPSLRPDACTKESRRRLMWSCYIADSLIGSGVDQLTLIREEDMKIQLPCSERNFLHQTSCITELLHSNTTLPFVPSRQLSSGPGDNLGIRAHYLRHISIRRRVLK